MTRLVLVFMTFMAVCFAKPPAISPQDTKGKIQEILRSHACYHSLNQELIARSFKNMIDELDPLKLYFLNDEIQAYLEPTNELCAKTIDDFNNSSFTEYLKLHALMEKAIERRSRLESKATISSEKISAKAFKDINFSDSEESLLTRLCQVKSLHEQTLLKLKEDPQKFLNKIQKRRIHHENEMLGK